MTEQNSLRKIERALISVSNKSRIVALAKALKGFGVQIISTGGTAKQLREAGIETREVSEVTGFPEMMDGRVKTLHPRVHGGLLALRNNKNHEIALAEHRIQPIDLVVVNLYPFEETIKPSGVTIDEAIEQIDIGGPAMIRSAAKNHESVTVVVSLTDYDILLDELSKHHGATTLGLRKQLAIRAFQRTAAYDESVSQYLAATFSHDSKAQVLNDAGSSRPIAGSDVSTDLPDLITFDLHKKLNLRYGENPHQSAGLYASHGPRGIAQAQVLAGKEMSYNNYIDTDAAWQLVCDFSESTCAIIKHTNPAGVGQGTSCEEAYRKALATDPVSAFGGIVAFNRQLDCATAKAVIEIFTEVVVAPDFDDDAIEVLRSKKNLRVLAAGTSESFSGFEYRQISGGMLVQTHDAHQLTHKDLQVVTKRHPADDEVAGLLFAWIVAKHTKSNAIVYARKGQTVGVGAGQMSRVDAVKLGAMRARLPLKGSVLASDAFFPFRDGIDEAAKHGITAIIEPGGSVKDSEVIAAADEHGLAMVFSGVRHFKH